MSSEKLESKRWIIAIAAVIMQLCLGTVYAWSVYKKPLIAAHGWGETATQVTFMICIGVIGLAAAFGGILVDRKGPRLVATIGGVLFGLGTLLAGYGDKIGNLWLLYLGFGLIAGLGNGFGYVTPIATLIRWFPDKRGLVTGLAVMGFGLGAFFMGRIAPALINHYQILDDTGKVLQSGVSSTFYIWGIIFLVLVTGAAQFYKNPPKGWLPAGFTPSAKTVAAADSFTIGQAITTPQWWMLWAMLLLNISAGLGLLSQLSPMAQEIYKKTISDPKALAVAGGTIVAIASIFNGLGRLFWAWLSDAIGRKTVFLTMFVTQAILYILLPKIGSATIFAVIACYLLSCYGGGFATMPAFAADSFGPANIGRVYGTMLTAWSVAGVVGPLVFAQLKGIALYVAAGLLILGFLIALLYKRPQRKAA
ncbi:MAG: OFA family MFS transporter [candidate division KSB1 bacterium]|nr:OFA family MFS transporter [candidate division KSB1 bacterium]MDZ7335549.1 OFA family MFS transporter [candidate division KSB1 bacterium]MDZ7356915.1 OFA family MFS transporter [candidate division KSB1 bacterium]MDZ7399254.1 OFA family MFS transporter [candidate division KSB1 bacterium]